MGDAERCLLLGIPEGECSSIVRRLLAISCSISSPWWGLEAETLFPGGDPVPVGQTEPEDVSLWDWCEGALMGDQHEAPELLEFVLTFDKAASPSHTANNSKRLVRT